MAYIATDKSTCQTLLKMRWRARTDLLYLCNEILGYKDVCQEVHGPIIELVQKFPLPPPEVIGQYDIFQPGYVQYTPWMDPYDLTGKRRRLLLDPRSGLKCLYLTEKIGLSDGRYVEAQDLRVGDVLRGMENDTSLFPAPTVVTALERQAPQDCYKVRFKTGREITVSHNHPFRFIDGWVMAEALNPGDRIALLQTVPEPPKAYDNPIHAELVGWLLGDGCLINGAVNVTNTESAFRKQVIYCAQQLGFRAEEKFFPDRAPRVTISHGVRDWLREIGIAETNSATKFVPEFIFRSNNESVARFLWAYFMCDGTASTNKISATTKSKELAIGVIRLLLRFGIVARIKPYTLKRGPYAGNTYYFVNVSGTEQVKRFFDAIGWNKANRFVESKAPVANIDTVPKEWRKRYGKYLWQRGEKPKGLPINKSFIKYDATKPKLLKFAGALGDPELVMLCGNSIYWDTVESVEYVGKLPTIAIETSTGNFAIDDIVTHNTTINCMAHFIQWILNFPHLAYLMVQSNTQKSRDILKEIKGHFQYNQTFRDVFPDYCPQKRVTDWGNQENFTVENQKGVLQRLKRPPRRESTLMATSIEQGTAGYHFDVMKFSDIVERENTQTETQIYKVNDSFWMMEHLLVRPDGWIDVEGTRYHVQDLYGQLQERWEGSLDEDGNLTHKTQEFRNAWDIHVRSCWLRDFGSEKPSYTPDSLKLPFKKQMVQTQRLVKGQLKDVFEEQEISWWPTSRDGKPRFSYDMLVAQRENDEYTFATQRLNDPLAAAGTKIPFPLEEMVWIQRKDFAHVPISFYSTTVDTASTQDKRSNYSVVTTCAWDKMGRCYVVDIRHGKMLPDELIHHIFDAHVKYRPLSIKIEETEFVRGLKQSIYRMRDKLGVAPNFEFIPRETTTSKQDRILRTLQPWYKAKEIRFLADLDAKHHLQRELSKFPQGGDDILDTLADQFQNREYFGRLQARDYPNLAFDDRVDIMQHAAAQAQYRALPYKLRFEDPDGGVHYVDPLLERTGGL